MPTLSKPSLTIPLTSGTSIKNVSVRTHITLTESEKNAVQLLGLKLRVSCKLFGEDGGLNGADDDLFTFPSQVINSDRDIEFKAALNTDVLDEDNGDDEIYALVSVRATDPIFAIQTSRTSDSVVGAF